MEFLTVFNEKRPVRLSEETRRFAYESLKGKYGDDAMKNYAVALDGIEGYADMSDYDKYDAAVREIVTKVPVRICENELISGAATLGHAIHHTMPATYMGEETFFGISHTTLGFDMVLKIGINGIFENASERLKCDDLSAEQKRMLESVINTIESMKIWHGRYLDALKDTYPENYETLLNVPFNPPASYREALQSVWFTFAFIRLFGNWPGIGRLDQMLGDFLKADLESGRLDLDTARELTAHFFIKGCEWIESNTARGTGDAQHYQNIILGGTDVDGNDVENEVTHLILDVVEELPIGDYPITIRLNENTSDRLLTHAAKVVRHGGGVVAFYNEPLIFDALRDFGYPEDKIKTFANDGCWEITIPGETNFNYVPFDGLTVLLNDTLRLNTDTPAEFSSVEEIFEEYKKGLYKQVEIICKGNADWKLLHDEGNDNVWRNERPCSVMSMFVDGCIQKAMPYLSGGPNYTVVSPHISGAADVGNSLYAIQKLVFEDKLVSFNELMTILQNNWEGAEILRQTALNKYKYYGNDCDESDKYTALVIDTFADMVNSFNNGEYPILFPAGVSTFGRQIEYAAHRLATPFGKRKGDYLAPNCSPTPGTDLEGATAIIKSYSKVNLRKTACGAALDIKLLPSAVYGDNGLSALKALFKGFVKAGGFFVQIDVIDGEILKKAQENPEEYKTLAVRVSGWNARFITLNEEWQRVIIERTAGGF